ncbi:GspH/FimT family pseudopilin [Dyella choica]|uniref:Type II secretion system protein H n=1 Tax=Dyella choica TaxID=1927959 RepID=A0A3S0RZY8_9GAMM|nr:GspH/FimT family pseudopilin [Dyella choica]RUL74898.1 type II secretion system protein GspH [Dyella choica]
MKSRARVTGQGKREGASRRAVSRIPDPVSGGRSPSAGTSRSPFLVRRSLQGFTLLEMLAVIILIGVAAAAVSISVAHGLASARINSAASELAASLRATRTQAIVLGKQSVFEVDTRGETYRGADRRDMRLPKGLELSVTSATSDQSGGELARIRFFPDGSSTGGRITLRSGQREWHVNVSWLTGAITLFDTAKHS